MHKNTVKILFVVIIVLTQKSLLCYKFNGRAMSCEGVEGYISCVTRIAQVL